ncbi:flavin-binding monooxygenase protein [Rutstroemia sp. NJR-2017a BVV2]|nr:flavin-binding monooxygenase protein [Rutstroemia sp. NJR-2017a BVV2]
MVATYATQPEIQKYFENVALKYQLDKSTTFNTEVLRAVWDDSRLLWFVETVDLPTKTRRIWSSHVLISAAGAFTVPKKADISGLNDFQGESWHSGEWPKNADLRGKTVAVIGTGPSAAQFIPNIYPDLEALIVYQRSPGHVLPRNDKVVGWFTKWMFANVPFWQSSLRWLNLRMNTILRAHLFVVGSFLQRKVLGMCKDHLYKQVKDETLRKKLESKDVFGCKRPLMLDNYFPIFTNQNVQLVTDSVTRLTQNSVVSQNAATGKEEERHVDVLIWGTDSDGNTKHVWREVYRFIDEASIGYNPVDFGLPLPTHGRSGQLLCDKYQPDLMSLYGVAVDDFPNYFNFLGPNSSSFETSLIELFELQAHYASLATKFLFEKNKGSFRYAVMPKEERVTEWTLSLRPGQKLLPPAQPECKSYYKVCVLILK